MTPDVWAAISALAPSMARPNGTNDGHTTSQARHCRHAPMISSKRLSTGRPAATADIAVRRPLGEAVSSPVNRKVGQLGRHSPHWMHEESSSARGA